MITRYIGTSSIVESNKFLRRLWSELNKLEKNGWNYQPYGKGNRIFIGWCNVGTVEFDYKERGCIDKMYIESKQNHEQIEAAIDNAPHAVILSAAKDLGFSCSKILRCAQDDIRRG